MVNYLFNNNHINIVHFLLNIFERKFKKFRDTMKILTNTAWYQYVRFTFFWANNLRINILFRYYILLNILNFNLRKTHVCLPQCCSLLNVDFL